LNIFSARQHLPSSTRCASFSVLSSSPFKSPLREVGLFPGTGY
jgi:hypothetical protein